MILEDEEQSFSSFLIRHILLSSFMFHHHIIFSASVFLHAIFSQHSLTGNVLVVIVVAGNPQMRSTTNLLIINLAVADLLFIGKLSATVT